MRPGCPPRCSNFVGIGEGMNVLEAIAGGGWYTEVLSAAVGPEGHGLLPERGAFPVSEWREVAAARAERLGNVEVIYTEGTAIPIWPAEADAAFTALNLHDMANRGDEVGTRIPRRHLRCARARRRTRDWWTTWAIAGQDNAELHRMEASKARELITQAGFVIEAESDILMNPEDDHTLRVFDPAIQGATDRMLFRARKPE